MKYWILLAIAVAAGLALAYNYGMFQGGQKSKVCFGADCFDVSLATTSYQRSRGLMGVDRLGEREGMLFVFDRDGIYPFWMKDTKIPLDMIWIDSAGKVVFIERNAQPCSSICPSIEPGVQARYVLEINAGASDPILVGDHAIIEY
jgi:uncharacterized protein